ncbi:type VI secretion system-associated protein TagO [Mixta calida]|uniref:type VI secretion system-associated protein TagO n=1 Tax=Mixta calida TaxID=665913 RepID=UPI003CF5DBF2
MRIKISRAFFALLPICFAAISADVTQSDSWHIYQEKDKLTDKTTVVAVISLPNAYSKRNLGRDMGLYMRCSNGKTESFVTFEDIVSYDDTQVAYRFDGGNVIKSKWSRAEGGQALFAVKPISFIKEMTKHKTMVFGFSPYGSEMQAVEFNIEGAKNAMAAVSEACDWK